MRQRISYILPPESQLDPAAISFNRTHFAYQNAHIAAEERKVTVGLRELQQELQNIFEDCHEIHIRIGRSTNYNSFPPQVSRVPPGLHLFLTPSNLAKENKCCHSLSDSLVPRLKCRSHEESLTRIPLTSERFANSPTFQFYDSLANIDIDAGWRSYFCGRSNHSVGAASLCDLLSATQRASYIDLDFDAISQAVTFTVLWSSTDALNPDTERISVSKYAGDDRLEVGVLQGQKEEKDEHLSLGGLLTVIGQDDHSSPTLFSFPSRHHPLPPMDRTTFAVSFQQPTGLHPKFEMIFPLAQLVPPKSTCSLHTYWTLPSTLFLDRYQLSDPLFLASQNLVSLRSLTGEQDLEAPNWAVSRWGSAALLELAIPPISSPKTGNWTVTIPTHLRYVKDLGKQRLHAEEKIPWPVVFWACEAEEGLKMGTNPFDRVNLGYDGLFGPKTMFYHIPPRPSVEESLVETLRVPLLDEAWMQSVPGVTMLVVSLGFAWVCWKLATSVGTRTKSAAEKKMQ